MRKDVSDLLRAIDELRREIAALKSEREAAALERLTIPQPQPWQPIYPQPWYPNYPWITWSGTGTTDIDTA